MRISDWSSDVCSSDLLVDTGRGISAMDFPAFDIDPVETLFLCAPARRFAEQGAGVEEELDHIRGLAPAVAAAQHCNAIRRPRLIPRHPGSSQIGRAHV